MRTNRNCGIVASLVVLAAGSIAIAQPSKKADAAKPSPEEQMALCMQMCGEAATPGPEHAHLAKGVGTWNGKMTMYMPLPDSEPMKADCLSTITSVLGGRFFACESKSDMGPMGMFEGHGVYGFDNVSKEYTAIWYDTMGTGMATGTGERSSDGKTMTWTLTFNCPVKKGPITMRQIERVTGPDTMVMEMYGPNMLTGEEYKMMEIAYTRDSAHAGVSAGH